MRSSSLVILHADPLQDNSNLTLSLAAALRSSFRFIRTVPSFEALRSTVATHRADVAIVDVELVSLDDVAHLSNDFSGLHIVCTHRLPDEELWAAALSVGAADLCPSSDISAILAAVHRGGMKHPTAA
jgi:hypothetical protein